jgi:hypothetical protein
MHSILFPTKKKLATTTIIKSHKLLHKHFNQRKRHFGFNSNEPEMSKQGNAKRLNRTHTKWFRELV